MKTSIKTRSLTSSQYKKVQSYFAKINKMAKDHDLTVMFDDGSIFNIEGAVDDLGNMWFYDKDGKHWHFDYHSDEYDPYENIVHALKAIYFVPKKIEAKLLFKF